MSPGARVLGLECLRCHELFPPGLRFAGCPRCRNAGITVNLTVKLDLTGLAGLPAGQLSDPDAPRGVWRYRKLLPVAGQRPVTLGEGATPLVHLERLGRRLGLSRLYAKDESRRSEERRVGQECAARRA